LRRRLAEREVQHATREQRLGDAIHRDAGDADADALARDLIRGELDALQRRRDDRDRVARPLEDPHALPGALEIDHATARAHEILARLRTDVAPALHLVGILDGLAAAPALLIAIDRRNCHAPNDCTVHARLTYVARCSSTAHLLKIVACASCS